MMENGLPVLNSGVAAYLVSVCEQVFGRYKMNYALQMDQLECQHRKLMKEVQEHKDFNSAFKNEKLSLESNIKALKKHSDHCEAQIAQKAQELSSLRGELQGRCSEIENLKLERQQLDLQQ